MTARPVNLLQAGGKKMFLKPFEITRQTPVTDIVTQDYRTADVFHKHGISYCCGGKWPLETACEMKGIDTNKVLAELEMAVRTVQICNQLDFANWEVVFLIEYIVNVHHWYLKKALPEIQEHLKEFAAEHTKKFPYLPELERLFELLSKRVIPSMQQEEEVIFPYISTLR